MISHYIPFQDLLGIMAISQAKSRQISKNWDLSTWRYLRIGEHRAVLATKARIGRYG